VDGKQIVVIDEAYFEFVEAGNFLIARLPGSNTLAYRQLLREGVMIRPMTGFRYPNHIRITLAQMEDMEAFVGALKKILY